MEMGAIRIIQSEKVLLGKAPAIKASLTQSTPSTCPAALVVVQPQQLPLEPPPLLSPLPFSWTLLPAQKEASVATVVQQTNQPILQPVHLPVNQPIS